MKLTKTQLRELFNQHIGTGYLIIKTADNNIRISDIGINRVGNWYIGLDGKSLDAGLQQIAKEVIHNV